MKLFHLYRVEDQSGVSGTGPVVEGVEFTNGWCAIRWMSRMSTVCFYQSMNDVKAIHGHGGKTELIIHDFPAPTRARSGPGTKQFELFLETLEEISSAVSLAEDPMASPEEIHALIEHVKERLSALEVQLSRKLKKTA